MNRKLIGCVMLLLLAFGTFSVYAKPRFQPNAQVLSRQKNGSRHGTQTERLQMSVTNDGANASFVFDNGRDRIDIAADNYGRIGFQYYNDGRLRGSGVMTEESTGAATWRWTFNFVTTSNTTWKSGDVWTWEVRY
jgi:hypothetical protein